MAKLCVAGLTKAFGGEPLLCGIDLDVPSGALVSLLGSSGSGKTTLLRLLSGFERADEGTITIGGVCVAARGRHMPPEQRRIGYVAQEGALFPHLSVEQNVLFGLPRSARQDTRRAEALLERVGLPASYAARAPQELSGGEQQRVALARALAPEPKLVLLDEPFSALDAALRVETRRSVAAGLAASGATALLVTHDQSEALSMGSQVAVLRGGVIVQVAPPIELYRRPVDAALARFIGEAVLLPGTVAGNAVSCVLGRLTLAVPAAEGPAEVLIRPEQIRLASAPGPAATAAYVQRVVYYGPEATVTAVLHQGGPTIHARVAGHCIPAVGSRTHIEIAGDVMAYPRGPERAVRTE